VPGDSQENVEIVREAVDALNSGDTGRFVAVMHPDFEGHVAPELSPEPDTYRGVDGIRRYVESFQEAFDHIRFDAERYSDERGAVVVAIRLTATAKMTKIPAEQRNGAVWTIQDRKVLRIDTYATFSDALDAARVGDLGPEQSGPSGSAE
jgi:ketosteroid isomerase-like protein